jgi:hypothetical protein
MTDKKFIIPCSTPGHWPPPMMELTRQILKTLAESEVGYQESSHIALCVACAFLATCEDDTVDILRHLIGDIAAIIDANRKEMAAMNEPAN